MALPTIPMHSGADADNQGQLARINGSLNSLSQSIHMMASGLLQVQSRLDEVEAAHRDSASAFQFMTSTIHADLQTMQRQTCQELCDFLGGQLHKMQPSTSIHTSPVLHEVNGGGCQSSDNLPHHEVESLRVFIQQEVQSLKALLVKETNAFSKNAAALVLAEAASNVKKPAGSKGDCPTASEVLETLAPSKNDSAMVPAEDGCTDDGEAQLNMWADFQKAINQIEENHNSYLRIMKRVQQEQESFWHRLLKYYGRLHWVETRMPKNQLAKFTEHAVFTTFQTLLILSNTAIMGYESDQAIRSVLQDPKGEEPPWLATCNTTFNVVFSLELLFRIFALRSWFFVDPEDWGWNFFDICVVVSSIATELMGGVNLSFIRTFRILRAVRAVRVVRVLRFFRELRKILLSILACLGSLFWCFMFLSMTMFMFSILILQGIVDALDGMDRSSSEFQRVSTLARTWYSSVPDSMFTLLAAFTAGEDFFTFHEPIEPAGFLYSSAYVAYMLFVMIGVMNVLTGVFLAASETFADRSLLIQGEQMEQESFVLSMLDVFAECDIDRNGTISWKEFQTALEDEGLQAFLAAHTFEVTHARLIFDILDEKDTGEVNLIQFVMGMLRLKGEAKAIDARIIQREIGMIPKLLNPKLLNKKYKHRQAHHQ